MATRYHAKTELFSQWRNGSLVVADQGKSTGGRFWVDSNTGTDSLSYGRAPESPFATLAYAFSSDVCTANNGDIIYVMEGHSEAVIAAGTITMDINGVSVIGLGYGDSRPVFTFTTAAAASILVSACDMLIKNCRFVCNIANQNHMIDLVGDDLTIEDCEFLEGTATGLSFITSDTGANDSDNLVVRRCLFRAPTSGNYDSAICLGATQNNWLIEDCDFYGDFDDACISVPAGGSTSTLLHILNNRLTQLQAGDHVIEVTDVNVTGMIADNKCQTDAVATCIDSSACSCHNNTWTNTDGTVDVEAIPANPPMDAATNFIGADNNNNAAATTNVAANADGSLLERVEYIQTQVNKIDQVTLAVAPAAGSLGRFIASGGTALGTPLADSRSLVDALGSDGTTLTDSATSIVGVLGVNDADNAFASANVVGNIDGSVLERLEYLQQSVEHCVVKADGSVTNPTDALFTVAGGPVLVTEFYGIVTTEIGAGASTCQIVHTATAGGATNFSTAVDIDADAVGTSYHMTVATPGVFTPVTAGGFDQGPAIRWFWPIGATTAAFSVTRAGVIAWYLVYKPLSPTSIVTAAA